MTKALCTITSVALVVCARAQTPEPQPRIVNHTGMADQVTVVEVAAHFVTAVRLPESITSVAVGDPTLFQVEHSEREPQLLFIKVLTDKSAETNLLISTAKGHQVSLLAVSRGRETSPSVDVLVNYQRERSFIVEPSVPSLAVPETVPVTVTPSVPADGISVRTSSAASIKPLSDEVLGDPPHDPSPLTRQPDLDTFLVRQQGAPLPTLYGEHPQGENERGERVRAGISQVIDCGQEVIALFSVVNPQHQPILLMPPQIQLGGKANKTKHTKHSEWTTAEQLPVLDYRLSKRRLAAGERADGVVVFDRPPYKQSVETLFLQMAEAGAVDHPALAPIGFGVSTVEEDKNARTKAGK